MLFQLGNIIATPGALEAIPPESMTAAIRRHATGDWGLCDPEDARENDLSVKQGFRILSVYEHEGTRFWILTESTREVTTILLPSEY